MSSPNVSGNQNAGGSLGHMSSTPVPSIHSTSAATATTSTNIVEPKHVITQSANVSNANPSRTTRSEDVVSSPIVLPNSTTLVSAHDQHLLHHHQRNHHDHQPQSHHQHSHQHQQLHHHESQSSNTAPLLVNNSPNGTPAPPTAVTLLANNPQNVRFKT